MAPNNFEFDFEQVSFYLFKSSDRKIFQDYRDPDLCYFHEINIRSKETTYTNETDLKHFLYETQRFENVSFLYVNIRELKTNFKIIRNLLNNTSSSFNIICLTRTRCSNSEIINSARFDRKNNTHLKEKQIKGDDLF